MTIQRRKTMKVQINIDEVVNGWRLDIFEDTRYVVRENVERFPDVLKILSTWTLKKMGNEAKNLKKSPTWEVI